MRICVTVALVIAAISLTISPAVPAVPGLLNLQGKLTDAGNSPLPDASYNVTFRIYTGSSGGTVLWTEASSVATVGGLFTTNLGSVIPVPDSVFNSPDRWLGIQVLGYPEMAPRTRLTSVAYANETAQWNSVGPNLSRMNGSVGIGTGGPNTRLTVWTPNASGVPEGIRINNPFGFVGNGNGASLVFSQDRDPSENYINATIQGAQEIANSSGGAYLGFSTKSGTVTEKMRITGNGNVGIGTISPSQRLHIAGLSLGDGIILTGSSPGYSLQTGGGAAFGEASTAGLWSQSADSGDAVVRSRSGRKLHLQSGFAASAITIASSGYVTVNAGATVYNGLDAYGSIYAHGYLTVLNGMTVNGGLYAGNGCTPQWTCPSDLRLKKNIQPLRNCVNEIHKLSAIRFDWRRDEFPERNFSSDNQIGLIAQEVQKVVPEAVQEDKDGYLSVDYSRLVPLLVGSIKEQQQMIEEQHKRIEKLEETIRRMQP